mmetsp:Transcript_3824/g.6008  ORF Transcript_3824/g.6008 Transcript_3824/m.6008 type:complete len:248 (-) Transcript_3824:382-1125(-)|eukprot:CAMPEP_0178897126 /NCGR_PEP_ID=MMETSP0786-20121207/1567_1 /TAXON_ID=186022 /ORGANISM="Thalassionema frauenfeldii, Strain CCMP 1798" /LENGTH=247 /DNA_ID=CAMNT_0020567629 /DNA_START=86 /DNA_END=829 /DNA_ORIENTATION=+
MHLALFLSSLIFGQLRQISGFVSPNCLLQTCHDGNHQIRRCRSSLVQYSSVSPEDKEKATLSLDKVSEMIDTSFVNACLQLAQGYVDVLKLFIVSVKSGYEMGVSPSELIENIDGVQKKAAGRDLMPEEIELRNTWIQVVYFVLKEANHASEDANVGLSIDESAILPFKSKYAALKMINEKGEDFRVDGLIDEVDRLKKPLEIAIVTQSFRVMWYTMVVLDEEERCQTEFARQDAPMKPPIPGAFDD